MTARLVRLVTIVVIALTCMLPMAAYADEHANDDIVLGLESDKTDCQIGETVSLTLSIANVSDGELSSAQCTFDLPAGMQAVHEEDLRQQIGSLAAGETKTLTLEVVVGDSQSNSSVVVEIDDDRDGNADSGQGAGDESAAKKSPETGDASLPLTVAVVALLVAAAAIGAVASRKMRHNVLSAFFALCLVGAVSASTAQVAFADEGYQRCVTVEQDIALAGVPSVVKAEVSYIVLGSSGDDGGTPEGIVYQDDVIVIEAQDYSEVDGDASSVCVSGATVSDVRVGDVVVLEPSGEAPDGGALKVESIASGENGVVVTGSTPDFEQVVSSLKTAGTSSEVMSIQPAEGVELVDSGSMAVYSRDVDSGSGSGSLSGKKKTFMLADGCTVSFTPSLDYAIDYSGLTIHSFDVAADYEADFEFGYEGSKELINKDLCSMSFPTKIPEVAIKVDFYLTVSVSGEAQISAKATATTGVAYSKGEWSPYKDVDYSYDLAIDARAKAGLNPTVNLQCLGKYNLVDLTAEVGGVLEGELIPRDTGLLCIDMAAWMYANASVGTGESVIHDLGLTKEFTLLSKKNSPRWDQHFEDWEKVDHCTYKEDGDSDDDVSEVGDPDESYPVLEDNGYGETPVLEDRLIYTQYCNKLVEPFNVNMGHSVQIGDGAVGSNEYFSYNCSPGTVFRLTEIGNSGEVVSEQIHVFTSLGLTDGLADHAWKVEVLCGRMTIDNITGWDPPAISLGTCETIDYPLHLSSASLKMKTGQVHKLTATDDFVEILGEDPGKELQWSSSDPAVAGVDHEGNVVANGEGTATITVKVGKNNSYSRTCEVTVS